MFDLFFLRLGRDRRGFDYLFDEFLSGRDVGEGRRRHYEVLRRMLHRYFSYMKYSEKRRRRWRFDLSSVDASFLADFYDYVRNEYVYVKKYPRILEDYPEKREIKPRGKNYMYGVFKQLRAFFNWSRRRGLLRSDPFEGFICPSELYGSPIYLTLDDMNAIAAADLHGDMELERQRDAFLFQCNVGCRVGDLLRLQKRDVARGVLQYIPSKTIKENAKTVVVPLNSIALSIAEKYSGLDGVELFPFLDSHAYNISIKRILELAGVVYDVTKYDSVTGTERKVPVNTIASSHMARRTFIGNIYRNVKDPSLVSSLTGHSEGSRAFCRYREIDVEMKRELVKILEK